MTGTPKAYAMRRNISTGALVAMIMIIGILGITNPGYKQTYQLFDHVEGKVTHNYFIFSIYQQYNSFTEVEHGRYREYKRYLGIGMNFFEISPLKVKQEE